MCQGGSVLFPTCIIIIETRLHTPWPLLIQWNLRIKDTLGPTILSTIEGSSSSRRSKNVIIAKGNGHYELSFLVRLSEGPLSDCSLKLMLCQEGKTYIIYQK